MNVGIPKMGALRAGLLLPFLALVVACEDNGDGGATVTEDGEELPVVRLDGVGTSPMAVPYMLIEEEGIDRDHGFVLEWSESDPEGGETPFLRGDFDVMVAGDTVDVSMANLDGHDTVFWYPMMTNYASIIVAGGSGYNEVEDLVGEDVGHFGDSSGTTLAMALTLDHAYGIDVFGDFTLLESPPAVLPELMAQGEFDAMFNFEPHADRGVQMTDGEYLFQPAHYWQEETDGWTPFLGGLWSHRDWLQENPELAENFQAAIAEAVDIIIDEEYAMFGDFPYIEQINLNDDEEVERMVDYCIDLPCFVNEWDEDMIEAELEWLDRFVELGILDEVPEGSVATLDQVLSD